MLPFVNGWYRDLRGAGASGNASVCTCTRANAARLRRMDLLDLDPVRRLAFPQRVLALAGGRVTLWTMCPETP